MSSEIKSILVPTDFSQGSREAVENALYLAEKLGASVELLHVCEYPQLLESASNIQKLGEEGSQTIEEFVANEANVKMKNFMNHMPKHEGVTVTSNVVEGIPYEKIVKVANEKPFDLIIMGSHGRTGLAHILLGSVAEKVVRYGKCPVLTIRSNNDPRDKYKNVHHGAGQAADASFGSAGYMKSEVHKKF